MAGFLRAVRFHHLMRQFRLNSLYNLSSINRSKMNNFKNLVWRNMSVSLNFITICTITAVINRISELCASKKLNEDIKICVRIDVRNHTSKLHFTRI